MGDQCSAQASRPAGARAHPPQEPTSLTLAPKAADFDAQFTWLWRSKSTQLKSAGMRRFSKGVCGMFCAKRKIEAGWLLLPLSIHKGGSINQLWQIVRLFLVQFVRERRSTASYTTERTSKLNQKRSKPNTIKPVWIVEAQPVLYKGRFYKELHPYYPADF